MPAPVPESAPRSYGKLGRQGPAACGGACVAGLALADARPPASAAERTIKVVALGDSLTAGYQLHGQRGVPGAARKGAQGQGARGRGRQRRRVRRHQLRRARPARLVGAGRHRCGDPRARRQRHAARHRSQDHARGAGRDRPPPEGAPHRGAVVRDAGRAESRAGLSCGRSTRSIRSSPRRTSCCSIRSSWTASWAIPSSTSATACIRPAKASPRSSTGILPKVEALLARVRAKACCR